jgi:thiosulfate/3-mercaptopyruvate sulfurtransferase
MRKLLAITLVLVPVLVWPGLAGAARAAQPLVAGPLVDVAWVTANLGTPGLVFLDLRGRLGGASKAHYLQAHIPGAIYSDYLKDGWRIKDKNGTVGMLPPAGRLEKLIGGLGIANDSHVVVVAGGTSALDMGSATRIYWTFKVLGHDRVSVLDGGMAAYLRPRGKDKKPVNPLESGAVKRPLAIFKASWRPDLLASKQQVRQALGTGSVLVDNRPNNQYLGVNKSGLAKRYGTLPGARNLPENWVTVNGGGMFRDRATLEKLYAAAGVPTAGQQINFCNTGHWASLGWFVSHELLGNSEARLYDGSMVEWAADAAAPMERRIRLD